MKAKLVLDRAARRRLQKLDRKRRDADIRVRIRVILKVALGLSCNAAARDVGCEATEESERDLLGAHRLA